MSETATLEAPTVITPAFVRYMKQGGGKDRFPFWITDEHGKQEPDLAGARAFKEKLSEVFPLECISQSYNVVTLNLPAHLD